MFKRILNIKELTKSCFILGPRQTGKTTLVNTSLANIPHLKIDLLHHEEFTRYAKNPDLFPKEISFGISNSKFNIVFVDEIQKLPALLDEIHSLIEQYPDKLRFILTGSSARKLKRTGVNLLAGRAWMFNLFPLTHIEMKEQFDLNRILQYGSLPQIVSESPEEARLTLESYTETYLKEEIAQEAFVRNLGSFNRFVELAASESGNIINYSSIAREIGLSSNAIKGYYQILEDTLLSLTIPPFVVSLRKRITKHPKVYLFDIGIINTFTKRLLSEPIPGTELYGKLFEHFIILELTRLIHYCRRPIKISYLRIHSGLEIDLILEEQDNLFAIEIKSTSLPRTSDVKNLINFKKEYPKAKLYLVCMTPHPYKIKEVQILPWKDFFSELNLQPAI